ncbi:MAG TPA: recombinase family protein [Acidimicrobiales bacterium]|nr:recombinase family protein [Acidimicrobiales bacterium]
MRPSRLHEQLDTSSLGGKPVFHLFGALAQFERDLIRERAREWAVGW